MIRIPRPYQVEAVDFLKSHPMAGLFMDMGLGKTGATLLALLSLPKPVLLIGPIRVIETVWEQEAAIWGATKDLSFSLVRGSPKARRRALEALADIYLVNPEIMPEALLARTYGTLVVDESSLFKNPSTKRFKTLRKHLPNFKHRIILTGTPTPNGLMDLWSQIFILDRGERLETAFYRFKNRYFRQADYMGFKFEPVEGALTEVTKKISDIILRVEAKGNLPARKVIPNPVRFNLPAEARQFYDRLAREAFLELASLETITAANAAAKLMKLRQVASGFVYTDEHETQFVHGEKLGATAEIISQTASPIILVYQFQHELTALKKEFPQGVEFDDWNQKDWDAGKIPLLFLHPQTGGHGLNLQYGSHTMILFSASFSFEQMAQTQARIDRQGQEFPVVIHSLIGIDTVDELIHHVLNNKKQTQAEVLHLVKEYADAQVNRR